MNARATKWVASLRGLGRSEMAVLFAMAALSDRNGQLIKSVRQIATHAGLGERTAYRAIASVIERQLVTSDRRRTFDGRQAASLFSLAIPVRQTAKNDNSRLPEMQSGQTAKMAVIYKDNIYNSVDDIGAVAVSPIQERKNRGIGAQVITFPLVGKGGGR